MMINLTELIKNQLYESLIMFCAGLLFMILYEIVQLVKERLCVKKFYKALLEICFWVEAAFLTSAFLYYCAYGALSIHTFCAFVLGALLWKKIFYGTIKPTD